jgi:hypothetical protein
MNAYGEIFPRKAGIILVGLALLMAAGAAWALPALPVIPAGTFLITSYGAVGDGATTNTLAISNAIAAAGAAGGGTVEVPAGTFLSGPFTLTNSINLQIDSGALLEMLPYGSYPSTIITNTTTNGVTYTTNMAEFIYGTNLHDVEISGPGTVDGQGAPWWTAYNANNSVLRPPDMVGLAGCQRVLIQNITFQNAPEYHVSFEQSDGNVTIQSVTVNCPTTAAADTDGISLNATNCLVQNSSISVNGDHLQMGGTVAPVADVLITNITFGTGRGLSIGSYTDSGASNITAINCTFSGSIDGIRLKSDRDRGGLVQDIDFLNIGMTNVSIPIMIYSYYDTVTQPNTITPAMAATNTAQPVTNTTPIWRDITISNLTATVPGGDEAGIIWGLPEMLVSNVTLAEINISASRTFDIFDARGIQFIDPHITLPGGSNTFTLFNADVTISNSAPGAPAITIGGADSTNSLALYNATASLTSADLFAATPLTLGGSVLTNSGNLTLAAATVQDFLLGASGGTVAVTSNLTLNSTINITTNSGFGAGAYTLFTYAGSLGGSPVLGPTPAGFNCSLDTNTAKKVILLVTQPASSNQYMYAATEATSGQSTLMQVDPVTGLTTMLFDIPLSFAKVGAMTYFPDTGQLVICTDSKESPTMAFINLSTHQVTEVPIPGLTTNAALQGIAYYPPLDAFVVTCGPTGTSTENQLAVVSTNGQVLQLSALLPFPDADDIVYNPVSGLLEIVDLNDTTGVQAVTNPFGSSPTYTTLGPSLHSDLAYSPAVSPTGQLYFPGTNGDLLTLASGSYVTVAPFSGAFNPGNLIIVLAFAPALPPQGFTASLNGAGLQLQGGGSPGASYVLLSATNLTPPVVWQPVATNPAGAGGNWTFTITNTTFPQRFYRAINQ